MKGHLRLVYSAPPEPRDQLQEEYFAHAEFMAKCVHEIVQLEARLAEAYDKKAHHEDCMRWCQEQARQRDAGAAR